MSHTALSNPETTKTMPETTLHVKGMTCGHCIKAVKDTLEAVEGVTHVSISLGHETVRISHDDSMTDSNLLLEVVRKAGYRVD